MTRLNVLTATLGLICATQLTSLHAEGQYDSLDEPISIPDRVTTHTFYHLPADSVPSNRFESHNVEPNDSLVPIEVSDSSKKNITGVNFSNEFFMSAPVDDNPLLTAILMYDPYMYRVWPRQPSMLDDSSLLDFLVVKPLFLPLVYGLHAPDYSLQPRREIQENHLLSTPRLDSLKRVLRNEQEKIVCDINLMQHLESSLVGYVEFRKEELPEVDPLVYILKEEKPMYLEGPQISLMDLSIKRDRAYPTIRFNPWTRRGQFKLHFSETYLSPNWSKGGESNMAGLATLFLEANYNNLKTVQYDNSLEVKIGLNTVSSDSLRNLNVSSDQLRVLSKLGIKLRNNWYYSLSSEFTTQLLNNYRKNSMTLLSSFMSPAKLFVSLGVDFKKTDKKKGYNLSVMLSPLTYKANYLYDNVNLNTSSYGIEPGKHFKSEIGSKVSSTITWTFSERISWKSKFYYFSDYTYVDTEWENTFDLTWNHFFSTQFYLNAKMDDRLKRKPGESLIQLQQLLSFGMTYHF